MNRWDFDGALRRSGLPAPSRTILWALASIADWPGGHLPPQFTPSLSTLAEATGLGRSTVAEHLNKVEVGGWVGRQRPEVADARSKKERTRYFLALPPNASPGAGLVRELDQSASPGDGLVQETDQLDGTTSPGAGPELVQELDGASPGAGHNPHHFPTSSHTKNSRSPKTRPASTEKTPVNDAAFDEFWSAYPLKVGKGQARKAWAAAIKKVPPADLIAGACAYRDSPLRNPSYTAHPTTWLNGERWTDEQQAAPNPRANGNRSGGYQPWQDPRDLMSPEELKAHYSRGF